MKLIIAEKNSVAATISRVVGANEKCNGYFKGNGYFVTWCVGHLLEMATPEDYNANLKLWDLKQLPIIPDTYKYKVSERVEKQYKIVENLCKNSEVSSIICATDAGREGELIFRLVYNNTCVNKPVERLWISSLEEKSIKKGLQELRPMSDYDNLFKAAVCRQTCDWLVGINFTRAYTKMYNRLLKVGRVQTPVVNLIVRRQSDIDNFISCPYFNVIADFGAYTGTTKVDTESESKNIIEKCSGKEAIVSKVQKDNKKTNAPELYDITALQRDANRLCKYSAKNTLDIVQSLYEAKMLTYPRTDSRYITDDMVETISASIDKIISFQMFAAADVNPSEINIAAVVNNNKVSDHHAIIITEQFSMSEYEKRSENEKMIINLVMLRMIESVMPAYQFISTKIWTLVEDVTFISTGTAVVQQGYKKASALLKFLINNKEKECKNPIQELPIVGENNVFSVRNLKSERKETQPPCAYTEDTLLNAMETAGKNIIDEAAKEAMKNKGLGTPATRADIIENIINTGYVMRQKNNIIPTPLARTFIEIVADELKEPDLTGDWEKKFKEIEQGISNDKEFIKSVENFVSNTINGFKLLYDVTESLDLSEKKDIGVCPVCGALVLENSKAFSCEKRCGFAIWKSIAGKSISVAIAKKLLMSGSTEILTGFKNKEGHSFSARLIFNNEKKVIFVYENKVKK